MRFEELIAHLGEAIGDRSIVLDADRHVAFSLGDVVLHLIEVPEEGVYAAYADVGDLPSEGRLLFMEQVLKANWTFRGTAGANLAINDENDKLALNQYWPVEGMTPEHFISSLNRFLQVLQNWHSILKDYRPEINPGEAAEMLLGNPNEVRIFL